MQRFHYFLHSVTILLTGIQHAQFLKGVNNSRHLVDFFLIRFSNVISTDIQLLVVVELWVFTWLFWLDASSQCHGYVKGNQVEGHMKWRKRRYLHLHKFHKFACFLASKYFISIADNNLKWETEYTSVGCLSDCHKFFLTFKRNPVFFSTGTVVGKLGQNYHGLFPKSNGNSGTQINYRYINFSQFLVSCWNFGNILVST